MIFVQGKDPDVVGTGHATRQWQQANAGVVEWLRLTFQLSANWRAYECLLHNLASGRTQVTLPL